MYYIYVTESNSTFTKVHVAYNERMNSEFTCETNILDIVKVRFDYLTVLSLDEDEPSR